MSPICLIKSYTQLDDTKFCFQLVITCNILVLYKIVKENMSERTPSGVYSCFRPSYTVLLMLKSGLLMANQI